MSVYTPSHLVGIVGGSGAGKGWLVQRLCQLLGDEAAPLQLDDFYQDRSQLPLEERRQINFDLPAAIDWDWTRRVLQACRAGRTVAVPSYDFATHCRTSSQQWTPRPLVLVDGLWLLHDPAIRRLFDLTVFLDTPTDLRCARRLARDAAKRGYSPGAIERQLRTTVVPMHERYVEPQKELADLVLSHPLTADSVGTLADKLWTLRPTNSGSPIGNPEAFRADLVDILLDHEYCN